jgi:hypothetical protein
MSSLKHINGRLAPHFFHLETRFLRCFCAIFYERGKRGDRGDRRPVAAKVLWVNHNDFAFNAAIHETIWL